MIAAKLVSKLLPMSGISFRLYSRSLLDITFLKSTSKNNNVQKRNTQTMQQLDYKKESQKGVERRSILSDEELQTLFAEFPNVISDLVGLKGFEKMTETHAWITKVVEYNVPHGKLIRPALLIRTAKRVQEENESLTSLPNLNRIAWAIEFFQGFATIVDDMMDYSKTRRDRPCWYLVDNLGHGAINDGLLLESAAYLLLKKYMKEIYPLYGEVLDLLHDMCLKGLYGQNLDISIASAKDYHKLTMDVYRRMMMFKNAYYTFHAPIAMGLLMNGINSPELMEKLESFSMNIGLFYSIQDDFLDCFVDPGTSGKIGTDIQDGKPSWLWVKAIERASASQRSCLLDNYGQNDLKKVETVKQIYRELNLQMIYQEYENKTRNKLASQIQELPAIIPKDYLHHTVTILFGRSR